MSDDLSWTAAPGLVAVVFFALRLTGAIDWPWWWVASPLWITGAFMFVMDVCAYRTCVLNELEHDHFPGEGQ